MSNKSESTIIDFIEKRDINGMQTKWHLLKDTLSEMKKQRLLVEIVEYYYDKKDFSFFEIVFDEIIDETVSLNFNIEHKATSLLSLTVYSRSRQLFDYFVKKGANINFLATSIAFEEETQIEEESLNGHFESCLDFAELELADMLTIHYLYEVPERKDKDKRWNDFDKKDKITISKREYYYLIAQAEYLKELIELDHFVDHIKSLGGKTYPQLKKENYETVE